MCSYLTDRDGYISGRDANGDRQRESVIIGIFYALVVVVDGKVTDQRVRRYPQNRIPPELLVNLNELVCHLTLN